ncbi:MAG TPA: heme ABC transporter ATP-binding protein CcmA [Gammaproteobacteria bacterium]|nr:heme ABC transporter ATP-binding protein CcmA [Gammaproteobacteria bacterium]
MLQVQNLCCERGDRRLFSSLDFSLAPGSLLYIEGANGSGKTTLLRTICGLFTATSGEVKWQGQKTASLGDDFRKDLIYLGHHNAVKLDLTCLENLHFYARLDQSDASENDLLDALEQMGLAGYEDLPVGTLSQGQKRRVSLARLISSNSRLWILDEPFTALDVVAVDDLQAIIANHVDTNNGMVILTTHQEVALTSGQIQHINLSSKGHSH